MGTLGRKVFREIIGAALLGAVLFSFVLFLQRIGQLFELLVRSSASLSTVIGLFLLVLPPTLANEKLSLLYLRCPMQLALTFSQASGRVQLS